MPTQRALSDISPAWQIKVLINDISAAAAEGTELVSCFHIIKY
jgi:hypothetical protein